MNEYIENKHMNEYIENKRINEYIENKRINEYIENKRINEHIENKRMNEYIENKRINEYIENKRTKRTHRWQRLPRSSWHHSFLTPSPDSSRRTMSKELAHFERYTHACVAVHIYVCCLYVYTVCFDDNKGF
jgi:hypothetical protein